jgi:aspartate/methionine/tyrosine aminotransferase
VILGKEYSPLGRTGVGSLDVPVLCLILSLSRRADGFDFGFRVRSSVAPVLVPLSGFEHNFTDSLIPALEEAYLSSDIPIKALILTNPHNPLAVCYPQKTLIECLKFCEKHRLHFISDEIYALSVFRNSQIKNPIPFTSILSIDLEKIGVNGSRVHMVWSMSKDFGQSGIRMVRYYSIVVWRCCLM